MASVGEILRSAREKQGRGIAEVAEELCITQRYLRALEEGDVAALPGIFFYKSFIRQYAQLLGIDEKLIQQGLEAVTNPLEAPVPPSSVVFGSVSSLKPIRTLDPIVESTNQQLFGKYPAGWSIAGLAAALVVCSIFYAWWNRASQPVTAVAPPPKIEQPAPVVAAPAGEPAASLQPAPSEAQPDAAAPETETVALTDSAPVAGVVLDLSAKEKTWISITSNGKRIFSGILQPSESKKLTADTATVKIGNAAGIEVRWNGKPIGPIGSRGEVRTVRFTPEDFQILTPAGDL